MTAPTAASLKRDKRVSLSDRIRRARRAANLSQAELARRIGIGPSAVAQWELPGGTSPKVEHMIHIATSCSVLFEWLATGRGLKSSASIEIPAVDQSTFAMDDVEERLLAVVQRIPARKKEPFVRWLEELF